MRKNEIDELIKTYEQQGFVELITKLYQIQKEYKDSELNDLLSAYMHLTNKNNHSYFYTSDSKQIVTNNTGSVIYFNKKLFDFKNINDRKIVVKQSFQVSEVEMLEILGLTRAMCGNNTTHTNDIEFINDSVMISTKHNSVEFNKQEFELIAKLLNYPSFNLSNDAACLYMKGANGYAYIKGQKTK